MQEQQQAKPLKQAMLVIFASSNGRDGWKPMKASEIPDWVKSPDNMARLVAGEMCMKCDEGDKGSMWYLAKRVVDVEAIAKAKAKRDRKAAARQRTLH